MKKWQKTCYSILIVLRRVPESGHKILTLIPYFSDYKRHPPPEFGRKMGGVSYSLNIAYIYIGEILCYLCY